MECGDIQNPPCGPNHLLKEVPVGHFAYSKGSRARSFTSPFGRLQFGVLIHSRHDGHGQPSLVTGNVGWTPAHFLLPRVSTLRCDRLLSSATCLWRLQVERMFAFCASSMVNTQR